MAKSKADNSLLIAKLSNADGPDAVILLSELRAAVGDDIEAMREYTTSRYRDDYLAADYYLGKVAREVRVCREKLLSAIDPKPAKPVDKPVEKPKSPEPEKPSDPPAPAKPAEPVKESAGMPAAPAPSDKK